MTTHNFYFLISVGCFVAVHVGMAGYYLVRSRRLSQATWEDLMAKLSKTDRDGITMVARELVDEWGEPRAGEEDVAGLEPAQLWSLVGGLEGLQVLEKNSEVLIEIAFYVQRWYPEALVISERLRLDARELRWHVSRLKGASRTGNLQISFPFYARRAVTIYYLMTRRVLRLYEAAQFSNLNELQQAL